jgi:acyl-CoA thioester hydrolase
VLNNNKTADVFEATIRVQASDIDELGHVNNVTYLRWVQEIAQLHWIERAPKEDQSRFQWIVLKHQIDYLRPSRFGEDVLGLTWIGSASRARFDRLTELRRAADGELLAKARTTRCPIDARTRRPSRVRSGLLERFQAIASTDV